MKTEMRMLDNGNYEQVISPIQHKCIAESYKWQCIEYGWDMGELLLKLEDGDPYEDGYATEIVVNFCPFCGYQPERSKREDSIVSEIKNEAYAKMMRPLLDAYEMRCSELYGNIERPAEMIGPPRCL